MANKREKVILVCKDCLSRNYTTSRNHATVQERLEVKKFCKRCGKHTIHCETK
ncbi:50S ribosomal protein L33 [Erysipelothrix inopinata]|uniref:Large ribosomal subunit protein bL33 n=1 Tax=Erysipelothrix inopinata TaxID=225084 RepID=A0A7G9RZW2_9FIRM|nr:50S ribosomal protein L33 [Erysipelothrix inopinata]QNN61137.1 50S ribosomal protein L33 [Erysipelothrix inopinata]